MEALTVNTVNDRETGSQALGPGVTPALHRDLHIRGFHTKRLRKMLLKDGVSVGGFTGFV